MCGITGLITNHKVEDEVIKDMINTLAHRGPDDTGFYIDRNVGLGQSRLSIMDPKNGRQPVTNEDESIVVIFNGEIFNHHSLRKELMEKGHKLKNNSDTAILPHMYEEYGCHMFEKLNGQFAIAIYCKDSQKLMLARDRFGEKPLYYYHDHETICFGSEVKAILKSGHVSPSISPIALQQVFTFWSTLRNRSIFEHIKQVPPAAFMVFENGQTHIRTYWSMEYSVDNNKSMDINDYTEQLDLKLKNAVTSRMMSDVPIAFYLSGGLDSSMIASVAAQSTDKSLSTFSIAFEDAGLDESVYQKQMSEHLGTNHQQVVFSSIEMPSLIKNIIAHTEVPLLRSGAFPMYVLARLVRENNTKVVLSGEGSDELFGGYDIFREAKIREFCSKSPESVYRASLYKKINNFVSGLDTQSASSLALYYNSADSQDWCSSHAARWKMGKYSKQFLTSEIRSHILDYDGIRELEAQLPTNFLKWTKIQQAQYLETSVFFSSYLLSSQGDRVSMAASVECRYPFLDNDVVEFANSLPDHMKIRALNEKYIVKKLAERYLPDSIRNRKKFPYRAPIDIRQLMKDEYISDLTSTSRLKQYGIFKPDSTARFLTSIANKRNVSERDGMMFLGILTTQVLCDRFL